MPKELPQYAELRCLRDFSFLRGASQPEELVERAKQLGYAALALTDECSLAGVVRAHVAAKEHELLLLIGSQFEIQGGPISFVLTVLTCHLEGYGNLSAFITKLRRASAKGTYSLSIDEITGTELEGCVVIASPGRMASADGLAELGPWLLKHFLGRCWIGVEMLCQIDDEMWLHRLRGMGAATAIPLVACGDVHSMCARANRCRT